MFNKWLNIFFYGLLVLSGAVYAAPPASPVLTLTQQDITVSASWTPVEGANGYQLFYAPYPFIGADSISSADMAGQTGLSAELWYEAAFYLAVQSYNADGYSDYSNVELFIIKKNLPPTAHFSWVVGENITLDGTGSTDPENDPLTYEWSVTLPDGSTDSTLDTQDPAHPVFVPNMYGDYVVKLIVSDGINSSAPFESIITATANDPPPIINLPPTAHFVALSSPWFAGKSITLDGSGSTDPEKDSLTYVWSVTLPDGSTDSALDTQDPELPFIPNVDGDYVVKLIVNDETNASAPVESIITIGKNLSPIVDFDAPSSPWSVNESIILDGTESTDPENEFLTYVWSVTLPDCTKVSISDTQDPALPVFVPELAGDYTVELIVKDSINSSGPYTNRFTACDGGNCSPTANIALSTKRPVFASEEFAAPATTPSDTSGGGYGCRKRTTVRSAASSSLVPIGENITLDGSESTDPENEPLTYQWSLTSLPEGSTASILDTQDPARPDLAIDLEGNYSVSLVVNDGINSSSPAELTIAAFPGIRAISMKLLQERLQACQPTDSCAPELFDFDGIKRLMGYVITPEQDDVILFGETTPSLPSLHLEDFVVALRNATDKYVVWENDTGYYSFPSCSIDPVESTILQLGQTPINSPEWPLICEEPQNVSVWGVPFNSRFASVMVQADYDMKSIADGTDPLAIPGFSSYVDMALADLSDSNMVSNRFWFSPGDNAYEEADDIFWLKSSTVQLLTEAMAGVTVDPVAQEFVENFSLLYPRVAEQRPIYADLENLFRFFTVAQVLESKNKAGLLSYLTDSFPIPETVVPETVPGRPCVKTIDVTGGQLTFATCGGVGIEIAPVAQDFITNTSFLPMVKTDLLLGTGSISWDHLENRIKKAGKTYRYNIGSNSSIIIIIDGATNGELRAFTGNGIIETDANNPEQLVNFITTEGFAKGKSAVVLNLVGNASTVDLSFLTERLAAEGFDIAILATGEADNLLSHGIYSALRYENGRLTADIGGTESRSISITTTLSEAVTLALDKITPSDAILTRLFSHIKEETGEDRVTVECGSGCCPRKKRRYLH